MVYAQTRPLLLLYLSFSSLGCLMPNKHNDKCRHKFKKATYKVKSWTEYNDALRKRGDITVWFTEEAIQPWIPENTGKKGRPQKSSL